MNIQRFDLAYPENSEIQFKISKFPDGQQTIDLVSSPASINGRDIKIYARIRTFRDIELIIAANQLLREYTASSVSLYVPYFLGSRSDRKFQTGGINYLKQVICPIINSQNFDCVLTLDPHSDVLEACLNRYEKIDNHLIVKHALTNIDNKDGAQNRIVLVSPDAGAYKKVFDVAQKFQIENIITATKVRDLKTGKILRTELPNLHMADIDHELKYVIVDDICDGGRTFIELAKAIHASRPNAKIYLIVTHGIFSNGLYELSKEFTKIYSSNSYSDCKDIEFDSDYTVSQDFLMQFNVF